MCKKPKGIHNRIDKCMIVLIRNLRKAGIETLGCCCGHGKYPMTIVYRNNLSGSLYDFCSGWGIPRKRNFYRKDKQGYYYIPEVSKPIEIKEFVKLKKAIKKLRKIKF